MYVHSHYFEISQIHSQKTEHENINCYSVPTTITAYQTEKLKTLPWKQGFVQSFHYENKFLFTLYGP